MEEFKEINIKIAEKLFGYKIVGEGSWDRIDGQAYIYSGEGGEYQGLIMATCHVNIHEPDDLAQITYFAHNHMCLEPLPDYSSYSGYLTQIIDKLQRLGLTIQIVCNPTKDNESVYLVMVGNAKNNKWFASREEIMSLALCKSTLGYFEKF